MCRGLNTGGDVYFAIKTIKRTKTIKKNFPNVITFLFEIILFSNKKIQLLKVSSHLFAFFKIVCVLLFLECNRFCTFL